MFIVLQCGFFKRKTPDDMYRGKVERKKKKKSSAAAAGDDFYDDWTVQRSLLLLSETIVQSYFIVPFSLLELIAFQRCCCFVSVYAYRFVVFPVFVMESFVCHCWERKGIVLETFPTSFKFRYVRTVLLFVILLFRLVRWELPWHKKFKFWIWVAFAFVLHYYVLSLLICSFQLFVCTVLCFLPITFRQIFFACNVL